MVGMGIRPGLKGTNGKKQKMMMSRIGLSNHRNPNVRQSPAKSDTTPGKMRSRISPPGYARKPGKAQKDVNSGKQPIVDNNSQFPGKKTVTPLGK